jgi:hypothetical protein
VLYALRQRTASAAAAAGSLTSLNTETASALSDACIQCARRSYRILTEAWINGSFPTFDYTYTQYLFSTAIILASSSLFQNQDSQNDCDDFEAAADLLHQLDQNGNLAAKEFCKHIEATKIILVRRASNEHQVSDSHGPDVTRHHGTLSNTQEARFTDRSADASRLTLAEPLLHDLLSQPDLDLQSLEPSIIENSFEDFAWPDGGGLWDTN